MMEAVPRTDSCGALTASASDHDFMDVLHQAYQPSGSPTPLHPRSPQFQPCYVSAMSSKHIINDPRTLVNDALAGLIQLSPSVSLDTESKVIHLSQVPRDRVALISGGGSGHEPSHAGFVGQGLLSAAVS